MFLIPELLERELKDPGQVTGAGWAGPEQSPHRLEAKYSYR